MSSQSQPRFAVTQGSQYRETYANSVQVRVSVWDIFLLFGLAHPSAVDEVTIENQQGDLPEPAAGQGPVQRAGTEPCPV